MKLILGDCTEELKKLPENSVDSIVTDPPSGISFMGKDWDKDKGGRGSWIDWMQEVATECKRVLKPGGHAFVWAIPRTSHWTATAWENAGFEIRDVVAHIFGSGFPKSLNIGKAVDKLQGNERISTGEIKHHAQKGVAAAEERGAIGGGAFGQAKDEEVTKGTSEWEGWGSALKPAREDWLLMRKPIEKGLSIAENVLKWGTGGINIDESRVDFVSKEDKAESTGKNKHAEYKNSVVRNSAKNGIYNPDNRPPENYEPQGRFPANLIHDNSEEVRECFPESKSTIDRTEINRGTSKSWFTGDHVDRVQRGDSGNASRFFKSIIYQAKASKSERNKGCEELEEKKTELNSGGIGRKISVEKRLANGDGINAPLGRNNHPTVKPIALMEYLIKMITPKGGTVLDLFCGSGSTGVACVKNDFDFIGIDMEEEYISIAKCRIEYAQKNKEKNLKLF